MYLGSTDKYSSVTLMVTEDLSKMHKYTVMLDVTKR